MDQWVAILSVLKHAERHWPIDTAAYIVIVRIKKNWANALISFRYGTT